MKLLIVSHFLYLIFWFIIGLRFLNPNNYRLHLYSSIFICPIIIYWIGTKRLRTYNLLLIGLLPRVLLVILIVTTSNRLVRIRLWVLCESCLKCGTKKPIVFHLPLFLLLGKPSLAHTVKNNSEYNGCCSWYDYNY